MSNILKFLRAWRQRKKPVSKDHLSRIFRFKYASFKMLLDSNTEFLKILADLEEKLQGRQLFGMSYVQTQSVRAVFHALRMVKNLDDLSTHHYPQLFEVLENINRKIKEELEKRKENPINEIVLPYDRIRAEMMDTVGGKNANLGEIHSLLHLPIPDGFAITTKAYTDFMSHRDLFDRVNNKKMAIDPNDPESISQASQDIQALITEASVPVEVEEAIRSGYRQWILKEKSEADSAAPRVSLRSSAIGEDSEWSFAGQYLSLLNVPPEEIIPAYKRVVASLYTPRAIAYRLNKGILDEDIAMSVACLRMVASVASGVIYTHHPYNLLEDNLIISAVWGLGPYAVEGVVTPDSYTVDKKNPDQILVTAISHKPVQLVSRS